MLLLFLNLVRERAEDLLKRGGITKVFQFSRHLKDGSFINRVYAESGLSFRDLFVLFSEYLLCNIFHLLNVPV